MPELVLRVLVIAAEIAVGDHGRDAGNALDPVAERDRHPVGEADAVQHSQARIAHRADQRIQAADHSVEHAEEQEGDHDRQEREQRSPSAARECGPDEREVFHESGAGGAL